MLNAITPNTRVVFVANPNNPTGTVASPEQLAEFIKAVPGHVLVALDEAYFEFLEKPLDLLPEIRAGKRNLLLMRTFSKIYGLAGLRLGYGIGNPDFIAELEKIRQPFNINAVAQAAALAALDDTAHAEKTRKNNTRGLKLFARTFRKMKLRICPLRGKFHPGARGRRPAGFHRTAEARSDCAPDGRLQAPGMDPDFRGHTKENQRCLEALKQVLDFAK